MEYTMGRPDLRELITSTNTLKLSPLGKITPEDVRRSFLQAVKRTHPDKTGGSFDEFRSVMHAYRTLSRFFDAKDADGNVALKSSCTFSQAISHGELFSCDQDSSYFFECRCGELIDIPLVALALDIRRFTCVTCSLAYQLEDDLLP